LYSSIFSLLICSAARWKLPNKKGFVKQFFHEWFRFVHFSAHGLVASV